LLALLFAKKKYIFAWISGQKAGKKKRSVRSQLKIVQIDFSKFQAYLPVPFLYPQGLLLYDLSNTGKDFMLTL
jgi:hypothetical protein